MTRHDPIDRFEEKPVRAGQEKKWYSSAVDAIGILSDIVLAAIGKG